MIIKTGLIIAAALAATGCGKVEAPAAAKAASATASSAAAVARIMAMPTMDRCGGDNPNLPAPTGTQVVDFGAGAFGILVDCTLGAETPAAVLFIQGPDGVLKRQWLINYNGPEYDPDYQWEPAGLWNITWDPTTRLFAVVSSGPIDDKSAATRTSTMHWRWDGNRIAMVDAMRVTQARPGAPATDLVTGYPKTPPIPDPTPIATPV
ncbi:hypothetical protein BH10PSE2_BH10PSE2_07980 [soil metagenome]